MQKSNCNATTTQNINEQCFKDEVGLVKCWAKLHTYVENSIVTNEHIAHYVLIMLHYVI